VIQAGDRFSEFLYVGLFAIVKRPTNLLSLIAGIFFAIIAKKDIAATLQAKAQLALLVTKAAGIFNFTRA
jgi:hypothetical protein